MIPSQNDQYELNEMYRRSDFMTSCQWLERRFLHSENVFIYMCNDPDDGDGCPKNTNRGRATKCCLCDPYETRSIIGRLGSENNDRGDFNEK